MKFSNILCLSLALGFATTGCDKLLDEVKSKKETPMIASSLHGEWEVQDAAEYDLSDCINSCADGIDSLGLDPVDWDEDVFTGLLEANNIQNPNEWGVQVRRDLSVTADPSEIKSHYNRQSLAYNVILPAKVYHRYSLGANSVVINTHTAVNAAVTPSARERSPKTRFEKVGDRVQFADYVKSKFFSHNAYEMLHLSEDGRTMVLRTLDTNAPSVEAGTIRFRLMTLRKLTAAEATDKVQYLDAIQGSDVYSAQ